MEAIHKAGQLRVRAIVMTSVTTIVAMIPTILADDLGSQLQKPLAIALMSTMIIGTLVSLYVVPVLYYLIYSRKTR